MIKFNKLGRRRRNVVRLKKKKMKRKIKREKKIKVIKLTLKSMRHL